ncbi:DsrE/DsrF/DrsH-like family protein [Bacillus sp. NEB1478]|uniref:DsrE/DsrF/DrsH-like family protein n=1 Tax=Bacillus sp. NEB1478 TaxID=3073816 RepID=UPI002872CF58|nr:DsrE/DsrF/DrsH-like family protein [Bacillus sp. NEB1478]WNB91551.1 DsrE/DsrF/DrsH-like family protein [Bacillus sp. NEB1478]
MEQQQNKSTMVVFSGDLDKAMASFIIATGAAAMGKQVTMFFTFWGLNILRKEEYVNVGKKSFMDKMFAAMMPRGPEKLGISKMNFGGLGGKMMKYTMKKKNIVSLKELIDMAQDLDVKMVACTMSMDVMGITQDELIDGLDYAGVASYLADADESKINLFI